MKNKKKKFVISDKKAQKIINKALKSGWLLWIKTSAWGNRKTNRELLNEKVKGNKKATASQKLVDHDEVKKVITPINRAMNFIRSNSLPWLTEGIYFVTEDKILLIDEQCKEAREEVKIKRAEFREKYPKLKKDAEKEYPEFYKESYYPTAKEVELRFDFVWGWQKIELPFSKESKINIVSEDMMKLENAKFQEMMKGVAEETIIAIRGTFLELITKLKEKLKDPNKKFKDITVRKPIEFLEELKNLNIYNDKPFAEVAENIKKILTNIDIEDLREDKKYRKKMNKAVGNIIKEFEELPVVKFKRSLEF